MRKGKLFAGIGLALVFAFGAVSISSAAPMSVAEKRSAFMKGIGGHMKALGAVAKGEAKADAGTVVHAMSLQTLALAVQQMFPEGSGGGTTRAKPEIWQEWDKFSAAADAMIDATPALVAAAQTGDAGAIGAALGGVGKTCGGCHKPFRAPEK
jgi:cytochrome c556